MTNEQMLDLAKSVGAIIVESGVLFVGYEQLDKYTQAATEQGKRQPLSDEQMREFQLEVRAAHDEATWGGFHIEFESFAHGYEMGVQAATRRAIVRAAAEIGRATE